MESGDVLGMVGGQILVVLPSLAGWTAALVVGIIVHSRGGGNPARFFIVGSTLRLLGLFLGLPAAIMPLLLMDRGWDASRAALAATGWRLGLQFVLLAAILCLVYAFWLQFKELREKAPPQAVE